MVLADYLVFWYDGDRTRATVERLSIAPHEHPMGEVLEEMLVDAIEDRLGIQGPHEVPMISGAVGPRRSEWGNVRDVVVGDGSVGTVEAVEDGWVVHI